MAWTEEQLKRRRREAKQMLNREGQTSVKFTCDDCPHQIDCVFVFDPYNQDGDCLEEK